jgi:hypothetical protein
MRANSVSLPRSRHLLTDIRGVCYSAFATPNLGITWAMVSLLGGLICLTYKRYKRRSFDTELNMSQSKLGSSYEPAQNENDDSHGMCNLAVTLTMKEPTLNMPQAYAKSTQSKRTSRLDSIQDGAI